MVLVPSKQFSNLLQKLCLHNGHATVAQTSRALATKSLLREKLGEVVSNEDLPHSHAFQKNLPPEKCITWDKLARIRRHEEIWSDKDSIVHRFPDHYKRRYWKNVVGDRTPVHYELPKSRFVWDEGRRVNVKEEDNPILPIFPPEADSGLWGGEGIVKGYKLSRPKKTKKILPRNWLPTWWWPGLKRRVLYSEILDRYMSIIVTERALMLIDENYGLDSYILKTSELDLASKLGNKLKREMMCALASGLENISDEKERNKLLEKYSEYIIPFEEAEWVGLDLNEAAQKLQDMDEMGEKKAQVPTKRKYETDLLRRIQVEGLETESKFQGLSRIARKFRLS